MLSKQSMSESVHRTTLVLCKICFFSFIIELFLAKVGLDQPLFNPFSTGVGWSNSYSGHSACHPSVPVVAVNISESWE